jgi:membrane-bound lytic murein transglycosylase D
MIPRLLILSVIILALAAQQSTAWAASACSAPHFNSIQDGFRYGFPPDVEKKGLMFAGSNVPIHRRDVRNRILKQVNFLLQDRRSRLLGWLTKADELRPLITPILRKYEVPPEFLFLAAIESSYNGRALSSAGAYGYWQFIKATAVCGPSGCDQYDWKMKITPWKDERADLTHSTHSAAKYLAWINRVQKVPLDEGGQRDGFNDWLLTAASYNAGPKAVIRRLNAFRAASYWDASLPTETETYVPRLIAVWLINKHRDFYGMQIAPNRGISFDTIQKVRLQKDLPFAVAAKLLDTTPREVWFLNTQISPEKAVFPAKSGREAIAHTINVPKGAGAKFLAQLAAHGYTNAKPASTNKPPAHKPPANKLRTGKLRANARSY